MRIGREFEILPKNILEFNRFERVEHRSTYVNRLRSNGIVGRSDRTLLDGHSRVEGRRSWYETIDEMQVPLDKFLVAYSRERPHQRRHMNWRTPRQAFQKGLPDAK